MKNQGKLFAWGILAFFLFTDCVFAAGDNVWKPTDTYRVMSFVVLVGLLAFFLRKSAANYLNGRIEQIKEDLETLEVRKKEAEEALLEYQRKLTEMDGEVVKIREEYKKQGEVARELIIKEGEASVAKMKAQARNTIEEEFSKVKQKLQVEIMEMALEKAEALIRDSIQPEDHERLTAEYIQKVVNS